MNKDDKKYKLLFDELMKDYTKKDLARFLINQDEKIEKLELRNKRNWLLKIFD